MTACNAGRDVRGFQDRCEAGFSMSSGSPVAEDTRTTPMMVLTDLGFSSIPSLARINEGPPCMIHRLRNGAYDRVSADAAVLWKL